MAYRPVVLCILDGWGMREARADNAVALARTPVYDALMATRPHASLMTSGAHVGLPEGQMGNSEVGHTNIGAGRVVWMDLPKIDRAIETGAFARNPTLRSFVATLRESGGAAHVMGLLSPGGVHAHQRHLAAAVAALTEAGVPVVVHAFTDGRDVPPKSALGALAEFEALAPGARFGSVSGRFYAMDRDNRWERVAAAFEAMVHAKGETAPTARSAVEAAYARGETDEFVQPTAIGDYAGMRDGDGVLCVNFRSDRAREILSALGDPDFDAFEAARPRFAALCGMVSYSARHDAFMAVLFPPDTLPNTLGAWVAQHGMRQFRIAETEKYPHVTFFLNGGVETPYEGEDRHMAPSPKVRTYDLAPEMSAEEVTVRLVEAIASRDYDLIVANYANPDMVGHTGDLDAAIRAVEKVDECLGRVAAAVEKVGGAMLVFADHGNCETMRDPETGGPHTAHTLNPAPLILVGGPSGVTLASGRLADVAPTALALMDLTQPTEMTGRSLLERG
jgi:2,3-bisphosphoglycerate-independent phosphoglycerate mutase